MPTEGASNTKNDATSSANGAEKSFISNAGNQKTDTVYGDFFQETSDGNITIGARAQKSNLEIFTTILGYVIPVLIILSIMGSVHVYLRNQKDGKLTENYSFLCGYLTYGIANANTSSDIPSGNPTDSAGGQVRCKSIKEVGIEYAEKQKELSDLIIKRLAEYIPIKITKNIILTSPERTFIINTFKDKVHMDEIIDQFELVRRNALSPGLNNVECSGLTIAGDGKITTQCTVYGGAVGEEDSNGNLGSARIEALRFLETLSETSKSQFILLNPPTSMSMEDYEDPNSNKPYKTRTSVSVIAQYVNFIEKN